MELKERRRGRVVILDVKGRVTRDDGTSGVLLDRLSSLVARGHKQILVNVAQVTYVDSVLLGAVAQAHTSAVRHGGTLKLLHVGPSLRELLRVTKLDQVLEVVESEDDAP